LIWIALIPAASLSLFQRFPQNPMSVLANMRFCAAAGVGGVVEESLDDTFRPLTAIGRVLSPLLRRSGSSLTGGRWMPVPGMLHIGSSRVGRRPLSAILRSSRLLLIGRLAR